MRYSHRQSSLMMLLPLGLAVIGAVGAAATKPGSSPELAIPLLVLLPIGALLFLMFSSLTITIDGDMLRWHFGWLGWPRKSLPLSEIEAVEITRTRWIEGWGIRRTRRGWLYNVAGLDAVLIRRRDGKSFLLGTDEPKRLAAAIERAIARR